MKYLSTLILLTVHLILFSQSGTYTDTYTGMSFVKVAAGSFTMGCTTEQGTDCNNAESPSHQVTLTQDYWMGKYEVTQAQWRKVMGSNPSGIGGCDACPVENVSWADIQTFLQKLNAQTGNHFRLPTEAEWEYAARGGTKAKTGTEATKYAGSNNIAEIAWYEANAGNKTHPSGKKQPNELGLYDMSGSVWEWCADWYGAYPSTAVTDPKGPDTGKDRVLRGGGWNAPPEATQVAFRLHGSPDKTTANAGRAYHDVGLRLCFSLTAEQEIDRTKMKAIKLTGDIGDAWGWVLSKVIDGKTSTGFHSASHNAIVAESHPIVSPYTERFGMFTIDMRVVAKLSKIKWWQRSSGDHRYNRTNPRLFEIWGTDKLPADNGASMATGSGWTLLVADGEVIKPSKSQRGTTTAKDNAASDKGFEYSVPPSAPPVRYIRFVNKKNWIGFKAFNIMEMKMYGKVEKKNEIEVFVSHSHDDVEELIKDSNPANWKAGHMYMNSSDLELRRFDFFRINNKNTWFGYFYIGVRFRNVNLPKGAKIIKANIVFTAKNNDSSTEPPVQMRIHGEDIGNAAVYENKLKNLSGRTKTTANVLWNNIPAWTKGDKGAAQTTVDLKDIVQEIASRPDWAANNAMNFILTPEGDMVNKNERGEGRRAISFDGAKTEEQKQKRPVLKIVYEK